VKRSRIVLLAVLGVLVIAAAIATPLALQAHHRHELEQDRAALQAVQLQNCMDAAREQYPDDVDAFADAVADCHVQVYGS
jgi:hypothetical protein